MTGLSQGRLAQGDELVEGRDHEGLRTERCQLVTEHVGKPICGMTRAAGLTVLDAADGFRAGIPFVPLQAACPMVGRLAAARSDLTPPVKLRQYDTLIGPLAANPRHPLREGGVPVSGNGIEHRLSQGSATGSKVIDIEERIRCREDHWQQLALTRDVERGDAGGD